MLSSPVLAPPRTDWYSDPERKPHMPPLKDSPHDVVITIEELKTLVKRSLVVGMGALVSIGLHFQSSLLDVQKKNNAQDLLIQQQGLQADYVKDQLNRMQTFIDNSQRNQSDILLQLNALGSKTASTEEVTRATQSHVETLSEYLRNNSKINTEHDKLK